MPSAHATIVAQLRAAIHSGDVGVLADVSHPSLRRVETPAGPRSLEDWLADIHHLGLRATAEQSYAYPDAVVLGLTPHSGTGIGTGLARFATFHIRDGRLAVIHSFDDLTPALHAAYVGLAASPSGASDNHRGGRNPVVVGEYSTTVEGPLPAGFAGVGSPGCGRAGRARRWGGASPRVAAVPTEEVVMHEMLPELAVEADTSTVVWHISARRAMQLLCGRPVPGPLAAADELVSSERQCASCLRAYRGLAAGAEESRSA